MLRSYRLAFAIALLLAPVPAFAGATSCLTGTAPEVVGDDDDIRDARDVIDAACPCATYDGSDGLGRGDYLSCVKTAMDSITALRKQCTGVVKKIYKASRCGRAAILGARPCIYESLADGKLSCKVRYTNKKDGTPNDKCVSNTKYTATPCNSHDFCLDAADTNQDLLIAAPGDDGQCYAPAGETICQSLGSGDCSSTVGTSGTVLVGDVLTPGMIYRGGQVVIDDTGVIVHVGCASSCTGPCATLAGTATTVTCPDGAISPGLINTHDHLTFSQNQPYNDTGERYEHRHDWRLGLNGHTEIPTVGGATANEVRYGELRHLMSGATSLVGSGGQSGLARNLDSNLQEGLADIAVDVQAFPLGDTAGAQLASGCGYSMSMVEPADIAADDAYFPHISEGVDAFTRNEYTCLSQSPNDVILDKTGLTGGMALTIAQISHNAATGASLVWSPRSNISLYGDTAYVTAYHRLGVNIALGTDWMPTGSMNMLRELRCAASFDDDYLGDAFTSEDLWLMATKNAAEAAAFPAIGVLEAGRAADIAIYDESAADGYDAVVSADPQDVLLVVRGGKALFGDSTLASTLNGTPACETTTVCGETREVCIQDEIGTTFAALVSSLPMAYPLYFCGDPSNEPSCVPSRPVSVSSSSTYDGTPSAPDEDADGVLDTSDNCLGVFNPIRPVDGGVQADGDADGEGDPCDPCPLDADVTVCVFDPNDPDSDGVASGMDNCPFVANAGQADDDADQHGNVCDDCPSIANPGSAHCPELATFDPTGMYIRQGDSNSPTFPEQLVVQLVEPAAADVFVDIDSSDPSSLAVVGGGVTVTAGNDTGVVLLDANLQSIDVTLTATLGSTSLPAHVRVLGAAEQPTLVSLTPASTSIAPLGTATLTVTLDIPAPPGGTVVGLALTPPSGGTIPASVTVLEDATQESFDYDDGGTESGVTVDATLGMVTLSSDIAMVPPGSDGLVINEVDYDSVGTDSTEFIEIHNGSASPVSLTGLAVCLVNGANNATYAAFNLSDAAATLAAGGYLVIGPAAMSLPSGTPRIDIIDNTIQNGAPDGVALVDLNTSTLLDALSYEGSITMAVLPGVGTASLVEGTATPIADSNTTEGSLARLPNGSDTDNANVDWAFSATPSPGSPNVP